MITTIIIWTLIGIFIGLLIERTTNTRMLFKEGKCPTCGSRNETCKSCSNFINEECHIIGKCSYPFNHCKGKYYEKRK